MAYLFPFPTDGRGRLSCKAVLDGRKNESPAQSGVFICVRSPILLARASCRTGTICQPRKFYYLLPVNRFRFSSSSLLLPCPRPADVGCSPPSSSTPYPHNVLRTQILGFGTYTSVQGNSYKSSDCFFLSVTTQNWTPPLSPVFSPVYALVGTSLCFYVSYLQFHSVRKLFPISRLFSP